MPALLPRPTAAAAARFFGAAVLVGTAGDRGEGSPPPSTRRSAGSPFGGLPQPAITNDLKRTGSTERSRAIDTSRNTGGGSTVSTNGWRDVSYLINCPALSELDSHPSSIFLHRSCTGRKHGGIRSSAKQVRQQIRLRQEPTVAHGKAPQLQCLYANGLKYKVTRYNRSTKQHEVVMVEPGAGCVRLMQSLGHTLGHDRLPTDILSAGVPTPAQLRGQFPGSAVWTQNLLEDGNVPNVSGPWVPRVSSSKFRPDEKTLRRGYKTYFGCGDVGQCDDTRCPDCWDGDTIEIFSIDCSRYMQVPRIASCGTGRLKGGDVRAATAAGPRDDWALGSGGGDNVEVHLDPSALFMAGPVEPERLTLVKILYFFRHEGNRHALGGETPPLTWWVLGYDYVGIGNGNSRVLDSVTGHPVLSLRGRGRPKVFPVDAIRRQVHLYHQCPLRGEVASRASFLCEAVRGAENSGKSRVWRHKFRLASPGSANGYDRYLLNEVHHSINQDTFV